ncbi:MAG: hypothetical protein CMD28_05755 [Flavobacteriales bacterium]|nr:hypothetical protein [Flavobacteriales bacterium]|tara:strand:+ start:322 stop:780 length:459 start_codon:yes stop_codon:yes gene_type:complete
MKSLLLIILLNLSSYNSDINTIRKLYLSAHTNEYNCNNLGKKLTFIEDNTSILIKGYEGCFYFIKCKFINNPIEKLIYFRKGKKLLETAIKEDPKSVELKFLRYSIQKNLPRFLSYHDNLERDLNFVNANITSINNKEEQKFIINSLKSITK